MTQNRMMNSIRGRPRVQAGVSDNDTCVQLAKNSEEIAMDTSCEEALSASSRLRACSFELSSLTGF